MGVVNLEVYRTEARLWIAQFLDGEITREQCVEALESALQAAIAEKPSQHDLVNLQLEAKWNALVVIESAKRRGPSFGHEIYCRLHIGTQRAAHLAEIFT